MKKSVLSLILGFLAFTAMAAENRYHPNHLFIKMKKGESLVKSSNISSAKNIIGDIYLVKTKNLEALSSEIKNSETIEYVEKDYYSGKRVMPKHEILEPIALDIKRLTDFFSFNDPQVNKLWAFNSTAGMNVSDAYDNLPAFTPKEVIVAVVDTGVDHNHEDLRDIMWINHGEIPGDGIDNDGNGYIDDIHGINTLVRDANGNATMNTMAGHWHGTHVAGTIAATQNNGIGIAGVANNVKIMAIRTVPDNADELDSDIVEAYRYASKMGANVINCSFGKTVNEGGMIVRDVINEIGKKHNVLVVVSAGNDSMGPFRWHNNDTSPKYPASFDSENMMTIASTDNRGALSTFSNVGKLSVDIASPGSNVFSTINGNKYGMASGTSMAAPNASGVAAMVKGYYPDLTVTQLKKVLLDSSSKVPEFKDKMVSGGRINLQNALTAAAKISRRKK